MVHAVHSKDTKHGYRGPDPSNFSKGLAHETRALDSFIARMEGGSERTESYEYSES